MNIAVNAGHCPGLDSGAVGSTGLQETDVAKAVSELVCDALRNVGYNTLFIQENELQDIVSLSNDFSADIFVSIHCNSASSESAHGTETFYGSSNGQRLAQCIQSQLCNTMRTTDRGLKTNSMYVVRNTNAVAVLVELAFISNQEEEQMLAEKQQDFAGCVARGITDYIGGL